MEQVTLPLLNNLDTAQHQAVTSNSKVILDLAGAGSGKTRVLVHRIAKQVADRVGTSNMLALTFTRLAAREMKNRLVPLIGMENVKTLFCGTFHSFCVKVLREWGHKVGVESTFSIYDEDDRREIIEAIIRDFKYKAKPEMVIDHLGTWDKSLFMLGDAGKVIAEYLYQLRQNNALDLDMLMHKTNDLLDIEEVRSYYQNIYHRIFIDEYQDTSNPQVAIIKKLNPDNLFVVGDDFQCWDGNSIVLTPNGPKKVRDLTPGDYVQSVVSGRPAFMELTAKSEPRKNIIIQITTQSGARLSVSPRHKCFASLPKMGNGYWFVYLMYRRDKGFRLGVTRGGLDGILAARTNPEQPEKLWLISRNSSKAEAYFQETSLSLKYSIPTCPYFPNGRALGLGQEQLDQIFCSFGNNGFALLQDIGFELDYPHYVPFGATRKKTSHSQVFLYLNNLVKGHCMVSYKKTGKRIRRVFSGRQAYIEARNYAEQVAREEGAHIVMERYCHEKRNHLSVIPTNGLYPTMKIPVVQDNGSIALEEIVSIEQTAEKDTYHLEVSGTGIVVADKVVSHNSIYGWRGANVQNILLFTAQHAFPNAEVVKQENNYRSTRQIVEAANNLISYNENQTDKLLVAQKDGPPVEVRVYATEVDEAQAILDTIRELGITDYSLVAVLARTNSQLYTIKSVLGRKIPCQLVNHQDDPFKKPGAQMVINFIRAASNLLDNNSIKKAMNIPAPRFSKLQMEKWELEATQYEIPYFDVLENSTDDQVKAFVRQVLAVKHYFENECSDAEKVYLETSRILGLNAYFTEKRLYNRLEQIREAQNRLIRWQEVQKELNEDISFRTFLRYLCTRDIQEKILQEKVDAVKLLTVHAAKGLEFPVVFLVGMNQGVYPSKRSDIEEERRLGYVAITRAMERLYISRAEMREARNGFIKNTEPSQFLEEIKKPKDKDLTPAV